MCFCCSVGNADARHATFPPGDGWFWRSARLAGKRSCVPLSYCVVRRGECKSGGYTCNTQREHKTKEDRATAPSEHIVCQLCEMVWKFILLSSVHVRVPWPEEEF